ncbi:MAG: hypothetical protein EBZ67_02040 [Chitinophagia bacterium]|nr:hypothetical protein [Chitinophagia bacterium]
MELNDLMDEVMDGMSDDMEEMAMVNRFPYFFSKAYLFLQMGADAYRSRDAFGEPSTDLDAEDLALIESGCRQMMEGRGLTPEDPLRGLGIHGFYALFRLFHFSLVRQSVMPGEEGMLDRMRMRHMVDGGEVVYYNLVTYDPDGMELPKDED